MNQIFIDAENRLRADPDMGKLLSYVEENPDEDNWLGLLLPKVLALPSTRLEDLPVGLYARILIGLAWGVLSTPEMVRTSLADAYKGKPCRLNSFRIQVNSYLPKP